ncbi:uncharacterized protein LOC131438608 [Malaya genurostris]|uniref:uncharacterized protein LOC131438608 n=1 Tax=Malaya genurostris TaxID=325434 RepID=UPI0026F3F302|nr:uncharacterized protein LOC131438608 [Malaya genurostris]
MILLVICHAFVFLGISSGYELPKPIDKFTGYKYPKPSVTFEDGYAYNTPSCPLAPPKTQYITVSVTETSIAQNYLPPVTSVQLQTTTEFVTLPRLTEYSTQTQFHTLTTTFTDFLTATTTEYRIQPTTVTSYVTSTYCAPNTYLPPPQPMNTYLPNRRADIELTTPNQLYDSPGYVQTSPIKRMTEDTNDANSVYDSLNPVQDPTFASNTDLQRVPATTGQPTPSINIIYLDSRHNPNEPPSSSGPSTNLMSWILCRFHLVNSTCANQIIP